MVQSKYRNLHLSTFTFEFFLSGDYNLSHKKPLKFYCYILLIYLTIFILFSLDVFLNFNLTKIFLKNL